MAEQWAGRLVAWMAGQMAVCSAGTTNEFWAEQEWAVWLAGTTKEVWAALWVDGPAGRAVGCLLGWDDG